MTPKIDQNQQKRHFGRISVKLLGTRYRYRHTQRDTNERILLPIKFVYDFRFCYLKIISVKLITKKTERSFRIVAKQTDGTDIEYKIPTNYSSEFKVKKQPRIQAKR